MDESPEHSEMTHATHVDLARKSDVDHSSHKGYENNHHDRMAKDLKKRFLISALLSIPYYYYLP